MNSLLQRACDIARACVPEYQHCYNVHDILDEFQFDEEVCIAGLLHEVIDYGMTGSGLRMLQFPPRIITLVEIISLEPQNEMPKDRSRRQLIRLRESSDPDAWAIKMADLLDQLRSSPRLPFEARKYLTKEAAPWVAYSLRGFQETPLGTAFFKEMRDRLSERIPLP